MTGPLGVVELDHASLLAVLPETYISDHEVGQLFFMFHCNSYSTIHLFSILSSRPVLDAHDPDEIEGPGDHDDTGRSLLPDHSPEVRHRLLGGALSDDVSLGLNQTIYI